MTQFIATNYHMNGPDNPIVIQKCDGTTMEELMREMNASRNNASSDSCLIWSEPVSGSVRFNLFQSSLSNPSLQSNSLRSSSPSLDQSTNPSTDCSPIKTSII